MIGTESNGLEFGSSDVKLELQGLSKRILSLNIRGCPTILILYYSWNYFVLIRFLIGLHNFLYPRTSKTREPNAHLHQISDQGLVFMTRSNQKGFIVQSGCRLHGPYADYSIHHGQRHLPQSLVYKWFAALLLQSSALHYWAGTGRPGLLGLCRSLCLSF